MSEILLVGGKTYAEHMAAESAARLARIDALAVDRSTVPPGHTLPELTGSAAAYCNRTNEKVKQARATKGDDLPMHLSDILAGLIATAKANHEGTHAR